jgi:hypothetical protein
MKLTVEVDCTPEEARRFLGLPDVKPLQAAAMAKIEKQMLEAADALSGEALLKAWFALVPQSPEQFRELFGKMFKSFRDAAGEKERG